MKCKECGNKMPISKPLLITVIVESIIIVFLLVIMFLIGVELATESENQITVLDKDRISVSIANDENSSIYYTDCKWCPNYGYVTSAKLKSHYTLDDSVFYTYEFSDSDLSKYVNELDNLLFEKNSFSSDSMIVYTRNVDDLIQHITIAPHRKSSTIDIYARTKEHK